MKKKHKKLTKVIDLKTGKAKYIKLKNNSQIILRGSDFYPHSPD